MSIEKSLFAVRVKQKANISDSRTQLLHRIERRIAAANAEASELELYAGWLRHGLVPAAHVAALISARGGLQ